MSLNGYNFTNNYHIDLKVAFWNNEERFTQFRSIVVLLKIGTTVLTKAQSDSSIITTIMNLTFLYMCHYTPKIIKMKDNFASTRKSRTKTGWAI